MFIGVLVIKDMVTKKHNADYQKTLDVFYSPPTPLPSNVPGYVIRTEIMANVSVPGGGTATRILYVTQLADGKPAVSSGIVFVPDNPAPVGGRPIVAWAHGTLGFGDNCTPSRNPDGPLHDTENWLGAMMERGWVVAATDYTGLGTPGDPYYLIGASEAHDVINSVRAARNLDNTSATNQYAVWGHSQGGHSSLFTAQLSNSYAPELNLVGAAAAAPAAELNSLFSQQYNQAVAWAIGPDTAVSWPLVYPSLPVNPILTNAGQRNYQKLAYGCIRSELPGLAVRAKFKQQFFVSDPSQNKAWYNAAKDQTPNLGAANVPLYIAQGLNDTVVLPNTTALFVKNTCANGASITTNWLGNTTHLQVAVVAGPSVVYWLSDRFANEPLVSDCAQAPPIDPATPPTSP